MTDEQIKKALGKFKCVNCNGDCAKESYEDLDCPLNLVKFALDLINRQKAEIERKTKHIAEIIDEYARFKEAAKRQEQARVRNIEQVADEEIKSLKAEIERLQKSQVKEIHIDKEFYKECQHEMELAKSEAYKEFAERLKGKSYYAENFKDLIIDAEDIDNLLEELQNGVKE